MTEENKPEPEFEFEDWDFQYREFRHDELSYYFKTPNGIKSWSDTKGLKSLIAGSKYKVKCKHIGKSLSLVTEGPEAPKWIRQLDDFLDLSVLDRAATTAQKAYNKVKKLKSNPGFEKLTIKEITKMRNGIRISDRYAFDLAIMDIIRRGK